MESYCCKPPKNFSIHGDLSENWRKFKQNFDIFLKASESEEKKSEIKVALLLNFMGEDGVELYNSFNLGSTDKNDIEKVIQAFQNYCAPKKNTLAESVKFINRSRADGETIYSYITSLKKLSETCEYGAMRDRMIRDRLVAGIRDRALQLRLLKTTDLDVQKAVEICRAEKAAEAAGKEGAGKKRKKQNSECEIKCRAGDTGVKEKANGGEISSTKKYTNKAKSEATFRYTVNISKIKTTDCQLSPPCHVSDLSWQIVVRQYASRPQGPKTLGVFLQCSSDSESTPWSCWASAELRILSNKEGVEPFSNQINVLFGGELEDWGFRDFMPWQDVLDVERGYVKDDCITLEAGASGSGCAG